MNVPQKQRPPPPHRHRHHTCHRHPTKPITGFCASCLRERLSGIDPDTHQEAPITHLAAELRRCKSYSCSSNNINNNPSSSSSTCTTTTVTTSSDQPRRKSCDVRARNSLSELFDLDDSKKRFSSSKEKLGLELKEEEEENEVKVRAFVEGSVDEFDEDGEFMTMKEFIDLEWDKKNNNGGKDFSFRRAASVFRNKLVNWQLKQKKNKEKFHGGGDGGPAVEIEKPKGRRLTETQSEIGEYGFGRRSCDVDPRLSVDAARYSFDEPRASWDGYLGCKTSSKIVAPLLSVMEVSKLSGDGVEDLEESVDLKNEDESSPGGTTQTRDFYSDRRRRRSFDRGSNRRLTLEDDEFKTISNAKVSPEIGLFHGAKLLVTEKELRDSNWYSVKGQRGESADTFAKDVETIAAGISKRGFKFGKFQRWRNVRNLWCLMQRRTDGKSEDGESGVGGNVIDEEPVVEVLEKLGGEVSAEANETVSQKLIRSYTVSARDSSKMACNSSSIIDSREHAMKGRGYHPMQRLRTVRYSPNHIDNNGMLRFYLTPLGNNYGRSKSSKSRLQNLQSMARNIL